MIQDTTCLPWDNDKVSDYLCGVPSSVNISATGDIACGSAIGALWLWANKIGCWTRRLHVAGWPQVETETRMENVHFTRTSRNLFYNFTGKSVVQLVRSLPLEESGVCILIKGELGSRVGATASFLESPNAVTAFGGDGGASVVLWKLVRGRRVTTCIENGTWCRGSFASALCLSINKDSKSLLPKLE